MWCLQLDVNNGRLTIEVLVLGGPGVQADATRELHLPKHPGTRKELESTVERPLADTVVLGRQPGHNHTDGD